MNNILELKNVSVTCQGKDILKNVSLLVADTAFVTLIGPNGAGKTTFLNVINGLCKASSGSVKVFNREVNAFSQMELCRDIGYVPQHFDVDPRCPISVREVVSISRIGKAGLFRPLTEKDNEIIQSAMSKAGITHLANRPIGHLSGGELQKVSIARAIGQEPKILLLDEPTANLDPKAQQEIMDLIVDIYRENKITTLFSTHILSNIPEEKSGRIILIKQGRVAAYGKADEVLKENALSDLYDFPVEIISVMGKKHYHMAGGHI